MAEQIRVLVVEDELIVGEAIRALLGEASDITVVDEANNAEEALEKARLLKPDVVLVDLHLPDKPGIQVIEEMIAEAPNTRILVLTASSDDTTVTAAFQAGALGYVLKTQATDDLVSAIHTAYRGLSALHPAIATKLVRQLKRPLIEPPPVDSPLTEPEERVLLCVARGRSNQEIAAELGVSISTVRTHVSKILNKLQLENRTQAALFALRKGMLTLNDVQMVRTKGAPSHRHASDEDDEE